MREALKNESDVEALKKQAEALAEKMSAVSTEIYKNAKPEGAAADAGAAPEGKDEKVVDADFEVVDKDKK